MIDMANGFVFEKNQDGTYAVEVFRGGVRVTYPRAVLEYADGRIMGEILASWDGTLVSLEDDETKNL